jgi:glycosyltransferase involved in cell wall biosynthesis
MYDGKKIALIMPARDEASALPAVLSKVPMEVDQLLVVDNGSTDNTAEIALHYGATVISERRAGYGMACLAGLAFLEGDKPDIVAFADADGSDDLSRLSELMGLIITGEADLVLERRIPSESGALSLQQRFGNWLATALVRLLWHHRYEDLGPMRAIRWDALKKLQMDDANYGWTIQMQIRAIKKGLAVLEHPLPYRRRIAGISKVSRNLKGTIRAGIKIFWVIGSELVGGPHAC